MKTELSVGRKETVRSRRGGGNKNRKKRKLDRCEAIQEGKREVDLFQEI